MSGIILAGGRSERMGRDKALLELDGRTLLERAVEILRLLTDDIIIVADLPDKYSVSGVRTIGDECPGKGPLGGLLTGLELATEEYNYALGCDMPFVTAELLKLLCDAAAGFEAAVPVIGGRPEPLCAVYHRSVRDALRQSISANRDLSLQHALKSLMVNYVSEEQVRLADPDLISFTNLNTPEEYARANTPR